MSKALSDKVQARVDGYHPHLALREIKRRMDERGPKIWDRLFQLAESPDDQVALKGITLLKDLLGVDDFIKAQIAIAKEQALNEIQPKVPTSAPGEDPEEDERVARRT